MSGADGDMAEAVRRFFLATSTDECRRLLATRSELLSDSAQTMASRLVELARLVAEEPVQTTMVERAQLLQKCHQLHVRGRLDLNRVFTEMDASARWEGLEQEAYSLLAAVRDEHAPDWSGTITSVASHLASPAPSAADSARAFDSCGRVMLALDQQSHDAVLLDAAVWAFRQAVQRAPKRTVLEFEAVSNLAGALVCRYDTFGRNEDRAEAAVTYRERARRGLEAPSEDALEATHLWSQLAAAGEEWSETAEACELAVRIAGKFSEHEAKVPRAGDMGAFALIKCERLGAAVITIERTRAATLRKLAQAQVKRQRSPQITRRGNRTVSRLLGAGARLGEHLAKISAYGNIVTVAKRTPLVYFTMTGYGGAAVVMGPDDLHEFVELPELTTTGLRDRSDELMRKGVAHVEKVLRARAAWSPIPPSREDAEQAAALAALATADDIPRWLWDVALGPLLAQGLPLSRMIIVPAGPIAVWPLHAAWTEDDGVPSGRRYALDESCITYAFNARMLVARRKAATQQVADKVLIVEEPAGADPLPYAPFESRAIRRAFHDSVEVIAGPDATRSEVLTALGRHSFVHFICHGSADPDQPLRSGLHMADGFLSIRDLLARTPSRARLATLTVCEGSLPGIDLPEEALSLVGAFLRTGFAGAIGSSEKTNDKSTAILMSRFYELWRSDGLEPPMALRAAQQWVRDVTNQQLLSHYPDLIRPDTREASWGSTRPFENLYFWSSLAYYGW